jgi:hypothetical protein
MSWLASGCGSEVTIVGGDDPAPPESNGPAPPGDPLGPPEAPGPAACGNSATEVEVSLFGDCDYGAGVLDAVSGLDPAPEVDGVRLSGEGCEITIAGVGSDVADGIDLANLPLQIRMEPSWIEIYPLVVCPQCVGCSCQQPLPILFAGDGAFDPPKAMSPRPVSVSRGNLTCSGPYDGCAWNSVEIEVRTFHMDPALGIAPSLLGTAIVPEGGTVVEDASGLMVRNLRSNGPAPECLAQTERGDAAWVVYRSVAPSL